jgi:DNA-binding IclR family transcriptional regulator
MGDASFFTGQYDTLSELSPSEQAVYVRLSLMREDGKVRGRYADIAKLTNVSLSTFKRVGKSLSARGLVEVVWAAVSILAFALYYFSEQLNGSSINLRVVALAGLLTTALSVVATHALSVHTLVRHGELSPWGQPP